MIVGLFGSSVTLSELEKALQTALKTSSKFGKAASFVDLGDGKGIGSLVGLLTADWTPENEELPKTFAVKISAPSESAKLKPGTEDNKLAQLVAKEQYDEKEQRTAHSHNTEAKIFQKFNDHNVASVRVPKVYAVKLRETVAESGFIIMEHIPDCASLHMNNNLPENAVIQLVKAVASFHNQSHLFSKEEQNEMSGRMFGETFNVLFQPGMMAGLKQMIKDFGGKIMKNEAEEMERVIDEMAQPEYLNFVDQTAENLGVPRLLCHGDVWMCNLLWKTTGEQFDIQAIIDLQTAQFSCPGVNLVRLFTGCCSGKQRQSQWKEFAKVYWEALDKSCDGKASYSYDQVLEAYRRMFPPAAFVVAGSIGAVGQMIIDKQESEAAKEEARGNLQEKQLHLLRNIIKYHRRNMDLIETAQNGI